MSKLFLRKTKNALEEEGSLAKYDHVKLEMLSPKDDNSIKTFLPNEWIEISEKENEFLMKKDIKERLQMHNNRILEKIENSKIGDELSVFEKGVQLNGSIVQIYNRNNKFVIELQDGMKKKVSMGDIVSVVNMEYYICVSDNSIVVVGTLISDNNGILKTYPKGTIIEVGKDVIKKIRREESLFLSKFKTEDRLRLHELKVWETVDKMPEEIRTSMWSDKKVQPYSIKKKTYVGRSLNRGFTIGVEDRGKLLRSDYIEHDIRGKSLSFVFDKIVDIQNIWTIVDTGNMNGWIIGDYVSTDISDRRIPRLSWNGELKWIGVINEVKCVGIDLEDQCQYGMDGVIKQKYKFGCKEGHGIVTTMDNIKIKTEYHKLIQDCFVDTNKFMRFNEKWNKEFCEKRRLTKDGEVFVIIDNFDGGKWRKKGILRQCGTMNDVSVAVVELNEDCEYGSNGIFWRHQLIQCPDKRAVAVPMETVYEYMHYQKLIIPDIDRRFKEINIDSKVIYYADKDGGKVVNNCGTVRWSGRKDYDKYLYGIELEDTFPGATDGIFKGQRLFQCLDGHGVVAYLDVVAPDVRFIVQEYTAEDVPKSQISQYSIFSKPPKSFRGINVGIQGNANSGYFDSSIFALFSKSDVLDYLIQDRYPNKTTIDDITKKFRKILSFKIVYPLREFGFVSFHHVQEMRDIIAAYGGKFAEMTKHQSDMENVASLLAMLCPEEELLSLRPFQGIVNKQMFLQLFILLNKPVKNITSQQMLDISMAQNNILFDKPPTCLIIQAPRDATGINCYENVLPSKNIEISNICYNRYKTCAKCNDMATYQCKLCIEESLTVKEGQFCNKHKCRHDEIVKMPLSNVKSRSDVHMQLKAIICIENAHFVAYVKEDEFDENWVFFDSLSERSTINNYPIPKVSYEENVTKFLNCCAEDMEDRLDSHRDDSLKRIIKDSYIFIYHNTAQTCY